MATSTFHIEDSGPEDLYEYLDTLEARSPATTEELQAAASELGHTIGGYERVPHGGVLGRLGVVKEEDHFELTEMGDSLVDIMYSNRKLFYNLLHYLYYTAYDRYPDKHIFMSYSYRTITNYLFDNAPFSTLHGTKGEIVGEVEQQAQRDNLDLSQTQRGVSVSTKTMNNYMQYLAPLEPSVNPNEPDEEPGFTQRNFCPPELFLMAVDFEYKFTDTEFNTLLRITDDAEHRIKSLCMISGEGFNEVMGFAAQAYPFFSKEQDFGLNVRLDREVTFLDFE